MRSWRWRLRRWWNLRRSVRTHNKAVDLVQAALSMPPRPLREVRGDLLDLLALHNWELRRRGLERLRGAWGDRRFQRRIERTLGERQEREELRRGISEWVRQMRAGLVDPGQ